MLVRRKFQSDPNALPPRRSFFICGRVFVKWARARWIFNIDSCGEQSPTAELSVLIPTPPRFTQPCNLSLLFLFFLYSFYIFLCILNLVDGLLLVHSIFGTQHERADKIAMFLHNTTPTTLLVLLYANTGVPVLLSALPSRVVKTRCCISWRLLLFLWYMKV